MGRRKKEPRCVHRNTISLSAQTLFMNKGIEATSMNDIAKLAGYSKATLYVYFENKEEIVRLLVLQSMKQLYQQIEDALAKPTTTKHCYNAICNALLQYQKDYPFYFTLVLDKININVDELDEKNMDKETYRIGEQINSLLYEFIEKGIKSNDLKANIEILPTIFSFWGMLSGLIQLATTKEDYIQHAFHLSKQQFLNNGFEMLYHAIQRNEKTYE